jgi:hypothetical protein
MPILLLQKHNTKTHPSTLQTMPPRCARDDDENDAHQQQHQQQHEPKLQCGLLLSTWSEHILTGSTENQYSHQQRHPQQQDDGLGLSAWREYMERASAACVAAACIERTFAPGGYQVQRGPTAGPAGMFRFTAPRYPTYAPAAFAPRGSKQRATQK